MYEIREKDGVGNKRTGGQRNRELALRIPLRIILNEGGASFFTAHKQRLHYFETAEGTRHAGFRLEKTAFSWLKKLLLRRYIEKIEIDIRDISVCRPHLEDAVKLVFFSLFRRRIDLSLLNCIYGSPMLRAWNRANPKKSIGPGVSIAEESFRGLLNSMAADRLGEVRGELFNKIVRHLHPSIVEGREDPREIHNFIRELIAGFNPLIPFVLIGSRREDRFRLIESISSRIIHFTGGLDVLNLASLLTVELVSAAERSALVRLLGNAGDIRTRLEDPGRRKSIMEAERFRGSTVVVAVPKESAPESRRLRFRISVYNDGADAERERKLMEDFTERSYSFKGGQDLEDFFKTPLSRRAPGMYEDDGLCFYYLTILQNQCRKNSIFLDTAIKKSHSGKSAVTTLRFGF
jgi:hypothetical protein